ncbi:MAG: hypothetical protein DWI00_01680 [Planctomycetota bacterium]|nr:MAG: hypothetical protein DWI00_01680 [Planctomycetota bacterium]
MNRGVRQIFGRSGKDAKNPSKTQGNRDFNGCNPLTPLKIRTLLPAKTRGFFVSPKTSPLCDQFVPVLKLN